MFAGLLCVCFGEKKDIVGPCHGQGTFTWVGRMRLGDRSGVEVCSHRTDCNATLVRILGCAPKVSPNRKFAAAMRLRHILISRRSVDPQDGFGAGTIRQSFEIKRLFENGRSYGSLSLGLSMRAARPLVVARLRTARANPRSNGKINRTYAVKRRYFPAIGLL